MVPSSRDSTGPHPAEEGRVRKAQHEMCLARELPSLSGETIWVHLTLFEPCLSSLVLPAPEGRTESPHPPAAMQASDVPCSCLPVFAPMLDAMPPECEATAAGAVPFQRRHGISLRASLCSCPKQQDELDESHSPSEGAAVGSLSHLPRLERGCRESSQSYIFQNVP